MNIYVGNLSFQMTDDQLSELFSEFGEVSSAKVVMDKMSGRSKGFAFVEMPDDAAGEKAIAALNGKDSLGRALRVNVSRPRD